MTLWNRRITVFFWACAVAMASIVMINIALGVFYDSDHFGDTLFLLGAGWRAHEGLTPTLDFGHFYGGTMANGLALTMRAAGHGIFVFDIFTLGLTAALVALAAALFAGRLTPAGLAALAAALTALILTRHPLEMSAAVTGVVSTHSFLYNRFGLAAAMLAVLFVALAPASAHARREFWGALSLGALAVLVLLSKPTFFVLPIGLALGLAVQGRWRGLAGAGIGTLGAMALLDPFGARWLASVAYAQAQVGGQESAQIPALIRKTVQIPLAQPLALVLVLGGLGYLTAQRRRLAALAGAVIVTGAGLGMAASMGGNGSLGQLALPLALALVLGAAEIARAEELAGQGPLRLAALALATALVLPHLANLAGAAVEGYRARAEMQVPQGPYARYLSRAETEPRPTQYDRLADGVAALHALGDPSGWGIIADRGVSFEYAVLGRVVPGYPLWQRVTAPELAPGKPLAPGADVVLLGRSRTEDGGTNDPLRTVLEAKMGADFRPCATSRHWDIFIRHGTTGVACVD